jgi:2-methylcitrate dehydratase PrpD
MEPLSKLADLATQWQFRPLDETVQAAVRNATLDWFATTLPGAVREPATLLAKAGLGTGAGGAVCYVDGSRTSPRAAAFINAAASHTVEFDDIFRDGGYHPGSPTVAAALAVAQDKGASREVFDRAIIGGYEIGCRLAMALQPSHYDYWHITGTVGTMGAAAAAAIVLGCDRDGMANAIAIASSFAGGHQQNLQGRSMVKAMHAGHAADAGLLAAYAAHAGATGARDSLDGPKGYAAATSADTGDWEAALEGAGNWTPITRMTVKIHGCCGHIFAGLDGLQALQTQHGFGPDDVGFILLEGYGPTKTICDRPEPASAQEARFSAQYCLAAQMVLGKVALAAFEPENLSCSRIRTIMKRIEVAQADDLAALYPRRRMARITVRLCDGRELKHFQQTRKGDPEDPVDIATLVAKFAELTEPVLASGEPARLQKVIMDGVEIPGPLRLAPVISADQHVALQVSH